jgi:hypothetical protein
MEALRFTRAAHIVQAAATMQSEDIEGLAGTMEAAQIIGIAAVTGEEITGIRTMDIPGWAITVRAIAIRTTGLVIMVTDRRTIIRTDITTLTATDTRCI